MNYFVVGIGTDVGKTVVSAILAEALGVDYWKPVSCGGSDVDTVRSLTTRTCYPEAYRLQAPLSPHHAARLEGIDLQTPPLPTTGSLVIEGVGGVMSPFSETLTMLDLFCNWPGRWIVVSRHYLGSINHTLLTITALKSRGIALHGLIFNGEENPDTERAILTNTALPLLGRLLPERKINPKTIRRYAEQWKQI